MNYITFLQKYTHNLPEPTSVRGPKSAKAQAKAATAEAKTKLTSAMSQARRRAILAGVAPQVKATLADAERSFFLKIQDPNFYQAIMTAAGVSSTDGLYSSVLNKLDITQITRLARISQEPENLKDVAQPRYHLPGVPRILRLHPCF